MLIKTGEVMSKVFIKLMALLIFCFMMAIVLSSCTSTSNEPFGEFSDKPLVIELYSPG